MASKIEEAQNLIKDAEKHLKTTIMKWKPDYDSAADSLNLAAQCYRVAKDLKSCKETYLRASDCYEKNKSYFHAAKAIENAILAAKEITTADELCKMAEFSCILYQQHGSGDAGASVLDKTAKIIENKDPKLALRLFQNAADVSSIESGDHNAAEYVSKASRILVRLKMYDQAVDSIRREIGFREEMSDTGAIGRLTVAIVLVQLAREDSVAAEKSYKEWGSNCEAAEMRTIEQLLEAYDEEDPEGAKRALASPFIKSMDVDYARLAQTIPLPKDVDTPAPRSTVRENAAASYVPVAERNVGVDLGADNEEAGASASGVSSASGFSSAPGASGQRIDFPGSQEEEEEDEMC